MIHTLHTGILSSFSNHLQQQVAVAQQSDTRELAIGQGVLDEQTTEQAEAMSNKLDDERNSESTKKINASSRLGSISAAFSSPVYFPPREETGVPSWCAFVS